VRQETTDVVISGDRTVLLLWRQSRTLSAGEIPLQTIHGDGWQDFVIERFGIATRAGADGSARDPVVNAATGTVANGGCNDQL